MDNLALFAAFQSYTAGETHFTRRMAIGIADFFGTTPRRVIQQLERLWILKEGSWDRFVVNGGFTPEHFEQARAPITTSGAYPTTRAALEKETRDG